MVTEKDVGYMRMAMSLAENGRGHVNPNPLVGAVIVREGHVAGTDAMETSMPRGRPLLHVPRTLMEARCMLHWNRAVTMESSLLAPMP